MARRGDLLRPLCGRRDGLGQFVLALARHRTDLTRLLARQGLPYPVDVARDAANRRADQPRWRRLGYQSTQGVEVRKSRPTAREFGSQVYGLDVPDPSAAVEFWRAASTTTD